MAEKKKPGNKPGVYTSPEEKNIRIAEGAKWMLANPNSRYQEFQGHFQKAWGVSERMVAYYWKDSQTKLVELYDDQILAEKKRASISLKNMFDAAWSAYESSKKPADLRMALLIKQELNKVLGLYVTNVDVTSAGEKLDGFNIANMVNFGTQTEETDDGDDTEGVED